MSQWSMVEARKTFKKVIEASQKEPQILNNRGEPVAVILDFTTYQKLEKQKKTPLSSLWKKLDRITRRAKPGLEIPEMKVNPPGNIFEEFS